MYGRTWEKLITEGPMIQMIIAENKFVTLLMFICLKTKIHDIEVIVNEM
jgi:hypothetical protein